MCRTLVAICLVLALASTCYADKLIGGWNTGMDGWQVVGVFGESNTSLIPGCQVGVTEGTGSLGAVDTTPGWNWDAVVATWYGGITFTAQDVINNSKLEFDITREAADNPEGWSAAIAAIQIQYDDQGSTGGQGIWVNQQYENLDSWGNGWGAETDHIVVDYSAQVYPDTPVWNVQIAIGTNNQGSTGVVTYYDNVRLTPEPATMALLGLGGLALIRRKNNQARDNM